MWTDGNGFLYGGDLRPGDREATEMEVAAWRASMLAPAIKAECARRIYAVVSDNTQKNMMSNAIAGNFTADDVSAWRAGVAWINAMRAVWPALAAAGDETYRDDAHWPPCPAEAMALAARW